MSRGRGRGGGGSMSFSMEQLGFTAGEALPGPVLQPPPTFPKLERPPAPISRDPELEYLLTLKRDFVDFVRDSPAFIRPTRPKTDIARYSDRYQATQAELSLHWPHFPEELRPQNSKRKAKSTKGATPRKVLKTAESLSNRLEELEKTEQASGDEDEEQAKEKEGEEEEEVEGEEVDDEMDHGTDYDNNYFDNGDTYIEDDEDMDMEGPVY